MATWLELLDDQRWQRRKNEILIRDNYKCQNPKCKSAPHSSVQVHHLYYFFGRMPWEYTDDMLMTLCRKCHEEETNERSRCEWYLLQTMRARGFILADLLAFSVKIDTDEVFTQTLLDTLRDFQNG